MIGIKFPNRKSPDPFTESHKQKIAETMKNIRAPIRAKRVKKICKVCGKEEYVRPSVIRKNNFCSNRCHGIWSMQRSKQKNTSIEIAIENELIKRNIPYLKHAPIEGIALVDFLLPDKRIIQCDGDYWHSKRKNKGKDIAQDVVLHFKGYKVFRFWEKDIRKSASQCIDKIK
ncbi:MAG: hypothetical protein DDT23_00874 [candidate division WS2 bacterium]|nr:hypothetical protein [Candidatus Lithacetigena glycinireducens]